MSSEHLLYIPPAEDNLEYGSTTSKSPNLGYEVELLDSGSGLTIHDKLPRSETGIILASSAPLVLTFLLQYSLTTMSMFAAGKLGSKELAAVSLAICTFNITGIAVYQGMATSLDSLCSQAYGFGNLHNVGLYFQRCVLVTTLLTLFPLSFIWWFSGPILSVLVPDQELAYMSQTYLRWITLGAPGLLLFEIGKRFLQAQQIFNAGTYILVIVLPFNFVAHWLLVWHPTLSIGFIGAPIAISLTYWMICLLMLAYVYFVDGKKCWGGFDLKNAGRNWGPMLKLAFPGVIMVEAEYFAFEILTVLAARFGTDSLAAQSIASNVAALTFQLPFAVSVAVSTRIGQLIGMKRIDLALRVIRTSYLLALGTALTNFSVFFFGRGIIGHIFTSSKDVLKISNKILVLTAINQLSDSFNVMASGVLRGQGRQKIGSILNLGCYYVVALPIGYLMAFYYELEISGLWIGLILGVFSLAASQIYCIIRSDWDQIIIDTYKRHDA